MIRLLFGKRSTVLYIAIMALTLTPSPSFATAHGSITRSDSCFSGDTAAEGTHPPLMILIMDAEGGSGDTPPEDADGEGETPENPEDPEVPDDPEDPEDPDDADDPNSTDDDLSELEAEREAVTAATEDVLRELEATRNVCRRFDTDMAAASLAADYQKSESAFAAATGVSSALHSSTQSFLQSGDRTYSGVQHRLTERQQTLRERFTRESAREVGDPIRISDGRFTFEAPLPVIRHWEITVDLTLRYDGAQSERSGFGRGWWWEPAQRTVPGVPPLPDMEPILDTFSAEIADAQSVLSNSYAETFNTTATVSHAEDQLAVLLDQWSTATERYSELRESLTVLRERAGGDPIMEPVVTAAITAVDELTTVSDREMDRFAGSLEFLQSWTSSRVALHESEVVLAEEEDRYTRYQTRHTEERATQEAHLPPGARAETFEIGSDATAFFDERGTLHTLTSDGRGETLSTPTLPWYELSEATPGEQVLREPSGTDRYYSDTGRLLRIEDGAGHALVFERDEQGRLATIRDETGASRAAFTWSDSQCVMTIPSIDPTTVDMSHGTVHRISGPRGSLHFEYEDGLLSRILRSDGSWTAIAREPDRPRRVTAVEQSTGAVERVLYESDSRRVYTDPDGYQTSYGIAGHRVRSVAFPSGLVRRFEYDEAGHLTCWTDNRGGGEYHTYDDRGALEKVEAADGTWRYAQRDHRGRITRVESDRGTVASYRYDWDGTITERTDATGNTVVFTRESDGSVQLTSPHGPLSRVTTDRRGNPREIRRSDGRREIREYDQLNRVIRITVDGTATVTRDFDGTGRLVSVTTADGPIAYRYGSSGHVVEITRNGTVLQEFDYDPVGNLIARRFHDGTEERLHRTPAGRINRMTHRDGSRWRISYDQRGRPTEIAEDTGERRREFDYAADGRIVSVYSTEEGTADYVYSEHGKHIGYRYADGSVHQYQVRSGGRVEIETPEGRELELDLDAAGRPREIRTGVGDTVTYRYRGGWAETTWNGHVVRTTETDRFGRLHKIDFPDGTSEIYSYADSGRTRIFTDRRGAVHTEERDHWRRPVRLTAGDGYQVRWNYDGDWVVETRSDGTSYRYRRDPTGAVIEEHSPLVVTRRVPGDGGAYRIETHTKDGEAALQRLYFDERNRLVERWSRAGGTVQSVQFPAPGVEVHRLLGYRERREESISGLETVYHRGEDVFRVAQTPGGVPRRIQTSGGDSATIRWMAPGFPATVGIHTGGDQFEQRYTYHDNRVETYRCSGLPVRRYEVDQSRRRVEIDSLDAHRAITSDPYGEIVAETIALPDMPSVGTRHLRDRHGRVETAETRVAGTEDATEQAIRYLPHRGGATITGEAVSMGIIDADDRTTITIDRGLPVVVTPNALEFADILAIRVRHGVEGSATISSVERPRASGFNSVLDAVVSVRNEFGQVIAEQRVDGHTQTFEYDSGGRLTAASGGPGGVITTVTPEVEQKLTEGWRDSGVSAAPPASPPTVNQHDLLYTGRASARRDPAGRIVQSQGTFLTYDETSGRPHRVTSPEGANWSVVRDARGDPVLVTDFRNDRRWTASTVHYDTRGGALAVRSWTLHGDTSASQVARYRPGSVGSTGDERDQHQSISCMEVSRNGCLLFLADRETLYVPFTDLRSTTRGLALINRSTGAVHYQRWTEALPEVHVRQLDPPEDGPQFPPAVPYDRFVHGMIHLPDTDSLWGVERTYLPELGLFTSIDPALHHLDWFEYAAGDPVNFVDTRGLRFIPIRSDHTHFQQRGWWNETPLGERGNSTVGTSGCVLTGVSNMINTISGRTASNPGSLNWYCRDEFFRDGNLLATEDTAEILQAATGHHIETVSFDPQEVNMAQVAAAIRDDTIQEYAATARIRTYHTSADGSVDEYEHTVNVAGFDDHGEPIIHDTSARNRTTLDHREEVLRYDVYAVSNCRGY